MQLAFGVAGASIGSMIPGGGALAVSIGWSLGTMAGAYLFPPEIPDVEGPKLQDKSVQVSTYGNTIPWAWGNVRLAGNIIWATDLVEERVEEEQSGGGKGGGGSSQTTIKYYYYGNFAVSVARKTSRVGNVSRIWADKKLIYTNSGGGKYNGYISIHMGDEDQSPSSVMQSHLGADNVPGYRGQVIVVFNRLPLLDFANHIPQIEVELNGADGQDYEFHSWPLDNTFGGPGYTEWVLEHHGAASDGSVYWYPAYDDDYAILVRAEFVDGVLNASAWVNVVDLTDVTYGGYMYGLTYNPYDGYLYGVIDGSVTEQWIYKFDPVTLETIARVHTDTGVYPTYLACTEKYIKFMWDDTDTGCDHPALYNTSDLSLAYVFNWRTVTGGCPIDTGPPESFVPPAQEASFEWGDKNGHYWLFVDKGAWKDADNIDYKLYELIPHDETLTGDVVYVDRTPWTLAEQPWADGQVAVLGLAYDADSHRLFMYLDNQDGSTLDWVDGTTRTTNGKVVCYDIAMGAVVWETEVPGYRTDIISDGYNAVQGGLLWLRSWDTTDGADHQFFALNIATGEVDRFDERSYWDDRSQYATFSGNPFYNEDRGSMVFARWQGGPKYWEYVLKFGDPSAQTRLKTIVEDICDACGLTTAQQDTASLTAWVDGYVVTRQVSGRGAIEPLQQVFMFDGVEIDQQMVFDYRYRAVVDATLDTDDLGTYEGSKTGGAIRLQEDRRQDVDLPTSVTIQYADPSLDHQSMTQEAKRHITVQPMDHKFATQVPVTMAAAFAKQVAEKTLYNMWVSRNQYKLTLPPKYLELTPGDTVDLVHEGVDYRMYLLDVSYGGNGVIDVDALAKEELTYLDSDSVVDETWVYDPYAISDLADTILHLLDIPLLREQDDFMGVYFAASSVDVDNWPGCSVLVASNGVDYRTLGYSSTPAKVGRATSVLATAPKFEVFDRINTVRVQVDHGTLASVEEVDVLNGNNIAMVGDEMLGFATATLVSAGLYDLSTLLRGLRGTEAEMSGHAHGDRFVALNTAEAVVNVATQMSTIGLSRWYKGVTSGQAVEDAVALNFINNARRLELLAPVKLEGSKSAGDWTLAWVRRTRYATNWETEDNAPLDDPFERYEVDIVNVSGTVLRTIEVEDATSVAYTSAQQVTDFGADVDRLTFHVYQISSRIGRGYGGEATVQDDASVIPAGLITMPASVPVIDQTTNADITPAVADVTLTGSVPVVARKVITVPAVSVTLSSAAPTVEEDHVVTVPVAEFVLNSQRPGAYVN